MLGGINDEFRQPGVEKEKVEIVPDVVDLQATLKSLGAGHVALYNLSTEDILYLILVTPTSVQAKPVALKAADLQKQTQEWRWLLQTPRFDPRPRAQKLYDSLLRPFETELKDARHLLLALDQSLGTIPYAALHDGEKYVVEKWSTSVFTPASLPTLQATPRNARALAVGASKGQGGNAPLPAVVREVKAIGQRVLLDEGFTEAAWKETLKRDRWDICHIASHFDFRGSEIESGLLLGDGKKLTLERLKLLPQDAFASISLITLSACQTATEDTDRSRGIVENFSVLAQRKGAGAVLASLWSVDDEATASLMVEFYRRWRGGEGKAQALQGAQLALLKGEAPPLGAKRGIESGTLPPPDAAPYPASETLRHPYYWAPFNLYGNTK